MPTAFPTTISEEVPKAEIQSIHEGETSKEDLRTRFGEPDWRSADDSRWIYEMRQYFAWGWHMCLAYGGQGGCSEVGERPLGTRTLLVSTIFRVLQKIMLKVFWPQPSLT